MPEKILTIDNSTFFVTCRIPGEEPQDVHWFLAGGNTESQRPLVDQNCQSVILDAAWIARQAEGKWLGCRYILNGIQHEKMLCFLSGNLTTLLKRNHSTGWTYATYTEMRKMCTQKRSEK